MKRLVLTTIALLFTWNLCFSQDTIVMKTNEKIIAKVSEITTTEIKYKKFDNLEGPIYIMLKSDAMSVHYENGTQDVFNIDIYDKPAITSNPLPAYKSSPAISSSDFYTKGQRDAVKYYNGYTGAGTGTLVTSLVSPLLGLVPAISCSSTRPKDINLNYPDRELIKNNDYRKGYEDRAKNIKQNKVWTNWGIGFGVNLLFLILIASSN